VVNTHRFDSQINGCSWRVIFVLRTTPDRLVLRRVGCRSLRRPIFHLCAVKLLSEKKNYRLLLCVWALVSLHGKLNDTRFKGAPP
jgi:hypothetical protein